MGGFEMKAITRRSHLAAIGAALLTGNPLSTMLQAQDRGSADDDGEVLYGHGLVWNRSLPGVAGELKLAFDLRVNLHTGTGLGTAHDPMFPEWNIHFSIDAAERVRVRKGEFHYVMTGAVTQANGAFAVGLPVRMLAETRGDATAVAIAIGDQAFAGAGLVVIAIIGILIGLLLPAVQKVPDRI
jgi:hypothetical protein